MLTSINEIINNARKNKYAVPHFNINNLEWAKFILGECNKLNSPLILGVSEKSVIYMGGYKTVFNIVNSLISDLKITIPVVLHLDHGKSFDSIKQAIDNGFTSVMIDASNLSLEDNIKITKEVVAYAHAKNISVEAELGIMLSEKVLGSNYTLLEDAIRFVSETNIDLLAPSVGNAHGLYKAKPKLNFDLIEKIYENTKIPLVLHGATGIDDDSLKKAISLGVYKINFNTELQIAFSNSLRKFIKKNKKVYDPRIIIGNNVESIKKVVRDKVNILNSINKG